MDYKKLPYRQALPYRRVPWSRVPLYVYMHARVSVGVWECMEVREREAYRFIPTISLYVSSSLFRSLLFAFRTDPVSPCQLPQMDKISGALSLPLAS